MTRVLWIIGLSIALLMFGGFTILCIVGLVSRHHLNSTGVIILLSNACISWLLLDYMRLKIRGPRKTTLPGHDTPERI